MLRNRHLYLIAFLGIAAACGSTTPNTPPSPPPAGVHILVGADVTDTVLSAPVQALIIQIVPSQAGTIVRLEQQGDFAGPVVLVSSLAGTGFQSLLVDTTDAAGKVSARVKLGTHAGKATLRIIVPEFGYLDSVSYTVLAGHLAGVQLLPRDTTLILGGSFAVRGGAVDQFGNDRPDAVTLSAGGPSLTVTGKVVTAAQPGGGRVFGGTGDFADTITVSVVPSGTLSAIFEGVLIFRSDGSGLTKFLPGTSPGFGADWSPDGHLLAFDNPNGPVRVMTSQGALVQVTRGLGTELYPKFSQDGQWLYYSSNVTGAWEIRRVRPDGTGDQTVIGTQGAEVAPAPSPDGTRMAYTITGSDELRMLTLSTGATVQLEPNGHTPAWSPDGTLIAYNLSFGTQEIWLVSPSGTGNRRLSTPGRSYSLGMDWSPDSRYLIARSNAGGLDLIDVATGTTFRLSFTMGWGSPAWKQ